MIHTDFRFSTLKNRISKSLNKIEKKGIVRNFGFLPRHVIMSRDIVSLSLTDSLTKNPKKSGQFLTDLKQKYPGFCRD